MKYKTIEDVDAAKALLVCPGDTLLETMQYYEMNEVDMSIRMDCTIEKIQGIINGKVEITPEIAPMLERAIGIPAQFWLNKERSYRVEQNAIVDAEKLLEGGNLGDDGG